MSLLLTLNVFDTEFGIKPTLFYDFEHTFSCWKCSLQDMIYCNVIAMKLLTDFKGNFWNIKQNSSVITQKGDSQYGSNKKTKHALFSCYLHIEIRSFALLLTNCFMS